MKELLDKISSYNLFNYLLPGIVFAVLAQSTTSYILIQSDIVIGVFMYYFIGLIISRIGSIIIEPVFMRLSIIKFVPHEDFSAASKKDAKLEILSEQNNMYRTFCSLLMLLALLKIYELLSTQFPLVTTIVPYFLLIALFVIFASAYRKQTQYIVKRVTEDKNDRI